MIFPRRDYPPIAVFFIFELCSEVHLIVAVSLQGLVSSRFSLTQEIGNSHVSKLAFILPVL